MVVNLAKQALKEETLNESGVDGNKLCLSGGQSDHFLCGRPVFHQVSSQEDASTRCGLSGLHTAGKVRVDKCLENGESVLSCNNLEILCNDGDDPDLKIEKKFDDDDTSISISSGTSSLSSATGSWLTISSSSCSIDEIHFQMNQLENPQKLDVTLPIAAGSDAVIMIEQENERKRRKDYERTTSSH